MLLRTGEYYVPIECRFRLLFGCWLIARTRARTNCTRALSVDIEGMHELEFKHAQASAATTHTRPFYRIGDLIVSRAAVPSDSPAA